MNKASKVYIAVVDDDALVRESLCDCLESAGSLRVGRSGKICGAARSCMSRATPSTVAEGHTTSPVMTRAIRRPPSPSTTNAALTGSGSSAFGVCGVIAHAVKNTGNNAAHTEYGVGYQAGFSLGSGMTFGYLAAKRALAEELFAYIDRDAEVFRGCRAALRQPPVPAAESSRGPARGLHAAPIRPDPYPYL